MNIIDIYEKTCTETKFYKKMGFFRVMKVAKINQWYGKTYFEDLLFG